MARLSRSDGEQKNEDQIIAESFGVPDRLMDVRTLLYKNEGAPRDLLVAIATAQDLPLAKLLPFEGRPLRALYTEGFCGGAVIPLGDLGRPANDVHVPLAHQSALAGVLLAAAGVRMGLSGGVDSFVAQYDVLKPPGAGAAGADGGGAAAGGGGATGAEPDRGESESNGAGAQLKSRVVAGRDPGGGGAGRGAGG